MHYTYYTSKLTLPKGKSPIRWNEVQSTSTPSMLIINSSSLPEVCFTTSSSSRHQSSDFPSPYTSSFPSTRLSCTSKSPSYWQRKLLPLQNLRIINPEEIRIQHRLHHTRHHTYPIKVSLRPIPPNPIRNIKRTVTPQRKEIMRRNGLRFSRSLKQEKLRKDRHAF